VEIVKAFRLRRGSEAGSRDSKIALAPAGDFGATTSTTNRGAAPSVAFDTEAKKATSCGGGDNAIASNASKASRNASGSISIRPSARGVDDTVEVANLSLLLSRWD